ncbi:hypothetical protein, partial [Pedobacter sp. ASV28]|uniref:hypothetical protein n=1 Tax=Pedobacter sp. ASV28 TaxID=2795123 RepID=UPI0018ED0B21
MKKLFFLLIAITFTSVSVNAQSTKPQQHKMQAKKNMECYVMKEGKHQEKVDHFMKQIGNSVGYAKIDYEYVWNI